ncbi:hypothetical protein KAT92_04710, partial [Candidatus Babeliales bacterium]|nr:hypothetical protein [Candidatus Babeliales bacterium]
MRIADYAQFNSAHRIPFQQLVYGGLCAGFGDTLTYVNIIRHFFSVTSIPLHLSRWSVKDGKDRLKLFKEILSVFKLEQICKLTNQAPTANLDHLNPLVTRNIISAPITFLRSPVVWKKTNSNIITYQFDAFSFSNLKAPSSTDLNYLYEAAQGYQFLRLGKHLSITKNLERLAKSACFIGIDSGISQLAYSVGVPVFLMRNGHFFSPNHAPHMKRKAII